MAVLTQERPTEIDHLLLQLPEEGRLCAPVPVTRSPFHARRGMNLALDLQWGTSLGAGWPAITRPIKPTNSRVEGYRALWGGAEDLHQGCRAGQSSNSSLTDTFSALASVSMASREGFALPRSIRLIYDLAYPHRSAKSS